jgi:hypothetical protein
VVDVRAVGIAGTVGERVVLAVVGDPGDHRTLDRRGPEDREDRADRGPRLEAAVREQAMEADRHAQPRQHVERHEDHDVAYLEQALPRQPRGHAERRHRQRGHRAGDDPVARLVQHRLDVGAQPVVY